MVGFNPMSALNPARIGLAAATGGASLISEAARNLASSFGQNLIQQVGDALGLPQPMIDTAQGAFAASVGDYQGATNNIYEAAGGLVAAAGGTALDGADFGREIADTLARSAADIAGGDEARAAKAGGKGGSWLMAMARALGEKANKLADQMENMADKMASANSKPKDSVEFSAKSQEFGLFMNAANTALKTAGESLTTAARKGG